MGSPRHTGPGRRFRRPTGCVGPPRPRSGRERGFISPTAHGKDDQPRPARPSAPRTRGQHHPLDLAALRRLVSIEHVLRHLGYLDGLQGPGPQRRGPCPLHDAPSDPHRSFSVHLGKGVFRCFHPGCQAQGNTLDLWAAYHRLPLGQAAQSLAHAFAPRLTSAQKSATEKRNP